MMDSELLKLAIEKSEQSVSKGGFPVGVILAVKVEVVATGISNGKQLNDPTSHAEIAAIRDVCAKLQTRDLGSVTLYSSMEPCLMCYGACFWASIPKIIYACSKKELSKMHSEGVHLSEVNRLTNKPVKLVHMKELEGQALKVIHKWESSS